MQEYSIVQAQTVLEALFALLSILIASYAFCSWKARSHSTGGAELNPRRELNNMLPAVRAQSHLNPASSSVTRPNASPVSRRYRVRSAISDWLVPILVSSVVVWTLLAVTIIFLGE